MLEVFKSTALGLLMITGAVLVIWLGVMLTVKHPYLLIVPAILFVAFLLGDSYRN